MSTEAPISSKKQKARKSPAPAAAGGASRSSRCAITFGIFSAGDFVRPEEQQIYELFCETFLSDLAPEGAMEQTVAAEIVHAAWRLRRCAATESSIFPPELVETDPMEDVAASTIQFGIDRARSEAHNTMQRAASELRRLQSERRFRLEMLPAEADPGNLGLASFMDMVPALGRDIQRQLLQHELTQMNKTRARLEDPAASVH